MTAIEPFPHRLLEAHRHELIALCENFGVARFELFGSASRRTDSPTSDLDFLVEFRDLENGPARRYFGLLFALEALFARRVDLIMPSAVRNPYMMQSINEERLLLYAA